MGLWQVFYEDWQMECCGEPFAVGDEVSWPLLQRDSADLLGGGWDEHLTEGDACDELFPGGRVPPDGLLVVNGHGGGPRVTGRVRAVRVVNQVYEENPPGSRTWEPVRGERTLRPVDRCPKWFDAGTPDARGRQPRESGVLVTLEIPDPGPDRAPDS
ncbi:DUF6578 domain-containing protein [Streptomyces griseoruber]